MKCLYCDEPKPKGAWGESWECSICCKCWAHKKPDAAQFKKVYLPPRRLKTTPLDLARDAEMYHAIRELDE